MEPHPLEKGYEPHAVEQRWYEFWEKQGLFAAQETDTRPSYSIVIPPPNVTGVLHMGHALNITLQDILCRYRRLCGDNVLWMPGTDHAGIATQNVVERQLAAKGVTRDDLGREKFIEAVWQWKDSSGNAIINQLKRLGASCDWPRERFTMDDGLSLAVRRVFVDLYHQGLIYRGDYIINWCNRCFTALSDLEVEYEEREGFLYHIHYPRRDGSRGLVVATTRPETMFGDVAVAVNPEDERYRSAPPTEVRLPLTDRIIPVIQDGYVGMEFGTGALKVTPAHDVNDFEIGRRHNLAILKVIDDHGYMTADTGQFAGMGVSACRASALEALKAEGLLEKTEPYKNNVGHCYRCKAVVEPNLSRQWFVKVKPLAETAVAAVRDGRTRIIPEFWTGTYYDWMNNIRDWCISRQIWWGHQIPAWTCHACNEVTVAMEAPKTCAACGADSLEQVSDVLDTWFSSALWPFSTMGWPQSTPLLQTFYPTSVLVTGFDILFFWVARMMMMGMHFMPGVPFKDVYVHALVRDEEGHKMSKSKGNVIDPISVIDTYGTDAFRFTLAAFAAQGRDVKMSEKRVEGYRHFINKLWNAARFALMHIRTAPIQVLAQVRDQVPAQNTRALPDRWILARLGQVAASVAQGLDQYRFNEAAGAIYQFVWHEFCDWYLEMIKPVLYDDSAPEAQAETRDVLWQALHDTLILLHPFAPFVTEEIWHRLPGAPGSIMQARFPQAQDAASDAVAEAQMALIVDVITAIRNIRGEMNLAPAVALPAVVHAGDADVRQVIEAHADIVRNLARLTTLEVMAPTDRPHAAAAAVVEQAEVFVKLEGIIDFDKECQRLEKEIAKLDAELLKLSKKINNEDYLRKAPPEVVAKTRDKYNVMGDKHQRLQVNLERMQAFSRD